MIRIFDGPGRITEHGCGFRECDTMKDAITPILRRIPLELHVGSTTLTSREPARANVRVERLRPTRNSWYHPADERAKSAPTTSFAPVPRNWRIWAPGSWPTADFTRK